MDVAMIPGEMELTRRLFLANYRIYVIEAQNLYAFHQLQMGFFGYYLIRSVFQSNTHEHLHAHLPSCGRDRILLPL